MDWQHLFEAGSIAWWALTLALAASSLTLVVCKRGASFLLSLVVYLGLLELTVIELRPNLRCRGSSGAGKAVKAKQALFHQGDRTLAFRSPVPW